MQDITLEAIAAVFFGDYTAPESVESFKRLLPVVNSGLFSFPVRFPWPLNKIPMLGFRRSLDACEQACKVDILNALEKRRADLASTEEGSSGGKSAGLLDSFITIQQNQGFDDSFIVDNVRPDRSSTALLHLRLCLLVACVHPSSPAESSTTWAYPNRFPLHPGS